MTKVAKQWVSPFCSWPRFDSSYLQTFTREPADQNNIGVRRLSKMNQMNNYVDKYNSNPSCASWDNVSIVRYQNNMGKTNKG